MNGSEQATNRSRMLLASASVLIVGCALAAAAMVGGQLPPAPAAVTQVNGPAFASQTAERLQRTASGSGGFPTLTSVGVPQGWVPSRVVSGDYTVSTAGAVVQDLRINGSLIINAANVTVRRVEVIGGEIDNWRGSICRSGLVVEDTTIRRSSDPTDDSALSAFGQGGYTARNVLIDGLPEGFRVGGKSGNCGPVTIENSYARVVRPDRCVDWHGDAIQAYDGDVLTVRSSVLDLVETGDCGGTAPFFYPRNQGNTSVVIDGLIVRGGGYSFRLGMPGTVRNLNIVNNSWGYGPIDVRCSVLTNWDARIVTLNATGQPVAVRTQPCNTNTGN